ncbi:MAG: DinB family protein [Sphingobacteriales bacterium]|nr:MAG: DinB family protein [Sphingobacteriales bacterium]
MTPFSKPEIQQALTEAFTRFSNYMVHLSDEHFVATATGKWNAGQHLEHLIKSIKPINRALQLPRLVLRTMFGKSGRESKTYSHVVEIYTKALAEGGVSTSEYLPKRITKDDKEKLLQSYQKQLDLIKDNLATVTEKELDSILLPHPLLGKLTLREILFFTIYHTQHHLVSANQNTGT